MEKHEELLEFAKKRLNDEINNGDAYTVNYWRGYIDGINALNRSLENGKY